MATAHESAISSNVAALLMHWMAGCQSVRSKQAISLVLQGCLRVLHSEPKFLTVSIVVYRPDVRQLTRTLSSLLVALEKLDGSRPGARTALYLVDNGGARDRCLRLTRCLLAALIAPLLTATVMWVTDAAITMPSSESRAATT